MRLHRAFPRRAGAAEAEPGGPLWFPRALQGDGRHDGPARYGCLYASEEAVSAVVEELARFAGTRLAPPDLVRGGLPLALAALELDDDAVVLDLDAPEVLRAAALRPSRVAARDRAATQADALALYERHRDAVGLRWWSALEPAWANVTLFDRALPRLSVEAVAQLRLADPVVGEAAGFLGLRSR